MAVNPQDKRYKTLIGKSVKLPLIDKEIPIIADDAVDALFGTGALKITPAHDPTDFEVAQRHNLPLVADHESRCYYERERWALSGTGKVCLSG